ncbi:hypothetical protein CLV47_105169 [Antricoccus suffuscus]|uniref:DUF8083 domain-containing protein n=2 Tax=Antricoccus suffuscus TaxID=1629062 RepID=A0A2T1A223_9ACTN|nr:hypothetical protein CLV47_105169 [Antricoccus suffuscus]
MSSLRVFEPLESFAPAEQRRWAALIDAHGAPTPEVADGQVRLGLLPAVAGSTVDFRRLEVVESALTLRWEGADLVCPLDTRPRALQAIVDSEWRLPFPLNEWAMSKQVRRHAARLQAHPSATRPRGGHHILTSNWRVPVWWCALFKSTEQVHDGSRPDVVAFRTTIIDAIKRADSAMQTMNDSFGTAEMTADLDSMIEWLRAFNEMSVVELDYGALSSYLQLDDEKRDRGVSLVAKSLTYLSAGDMDEALSAYHEFTEIWEEIARLEAWN